MVTMIILSIAAAVLSSSQNLRAYFNQFSEDSSQRAILAKIFTNYDGSQFIIFKIRTAVGIEIEIYEKTINASNPSSSLQRLKQRFVLLDDKDAYLMIEGNSVSLALTDIDKNGVLDIVAPTVDSYGSSRLNVFKYDSTSQQFFQTVATDY